VVAGTTATVPLGAMLPEALVGQCHRGSYFCREWELRVTSRALAEDLNAAPDAKFEELESVEIIKSFIKDRSTHTNDTRQVAPLTCGEEVWVLARGNDHRGATWFDAESRVVWLLAYGLHRSGAGDDFFPFCKQLDADDRLLPSVDDYERLLRDRDARFAFAIALEAPLILKKARSVPGEHRIMFGGKFGACMAIEVVDELEAITVAFRVDTVEFDYVPVILAALQPGKWELAARLPSRNLEAMEVAYEHLHER
jgi:hypothetical protein